MSEEPSTEPSAYDAYVPDLLASYRKVGGLNHSESNNLPSKRAVGQLCEDLLQLLFPGLHDDDVIHHATLAELTGERLNRVAQRLEDQVRKAMPGDGPETPVGRIPPILHTFCSWIPEVRELLQTDVEAAYEGDPAVRLREEIILAYPCIEAIAIQRLAHVLYQSEAPLIPRMMTEWAHARTGIDMHPGAGIGSHFFIDHGTGVVIGETCRIGNHVKLYHGVTLGARSFAKDEAGQIVKGGKRHPDVEDHVTIYPNSTILGGGTVIGARSTIGANVFLMHSVPPDSLVVYEEKQLLIRSKAERRKSDAIEFHI